MRWLALVAFAFSLSWIAACSSDTASVIPSGDGNIAGGAGNASSSLPAAGPPTSAPPPATTPPPAGAPPPADGDAGEWDSGTPWGDSGNATTADTGPGYFIDTGTGTTPQPTGAFGSCTNPACGTDGNECGCQATDSMGNQVQMGCQAGGQCVCVVNEQTYGNPFDETGACTDQPSTAQQFLQYCTCN